MFEDPLADSRSNLVNSFTELLSHGLTLECFDGVGVGCSGHDDESHNGSFGPHLLESVIKTCPISSILDDGKGDIRASDSINMSTPLFLNSYRPAVNI